MFPDWRAGPGTTYPTHAPLDPRLSSRLQVIAAAALFSTGGAAIKATDLSSWQVAGFRSGIAALSVLLLIPAARRGWNAKVLLVGLAYAATMVLFVAANKRTTSANAIFLQASAPLYVLLLGPWLLREPIRRSDLQFIGVVGIGLALFFLGDETPLVTAPDPLRGNVLALCSGVLWAITVVGLRSLETSAGAGAGGSALATVIAGNGIAFVACLPFALPIHDSTPADWLTLVYLGVFQIALAYVLLSDGIRHVPALEASVLLLAEPALNPIWAWLVHAEVPSAWALAGGSLIIGSTVFRTWTGTRPTAARGAVRGQEIIP